MRKLANIDNFLALEESQQTENSIFNVDYRVDYAPRKGFFGLIDQATGSHVSDLSVPLTDLLKQYSTDADYNSTPAQLILYLQQQQEELYKQIDAEASRLFHRQALERFQRKGIIPENQVSGFIRDMCGIICRNDYVRNIVKESILKNTVDVQQLPFKVVSWAMGTEGAKKLQQQQQQKQVSRRTIVPSGRKRKGVLGALAKLGGLGLKGIKKGYDAFSTVKSIHYDN